MAKKVMLFVGVAVPVGLTLWSTWLSFEARMIANIIFAAISGTATLVAAWSVSRLLRVWAPSLRIAKEFSKQTQRQISTGMAEVLDVTEPEATPVSPESQVALMLREFKGQVSDQLASMRQELAASTPQAPSEPIPAAKAQEPERRGGSDLVNDPTLCGYCEKETLAVRALQLNGLAEPVSVCHIHWKEKKADKDLVILETLTMPEYLAEYERNAQTVNTTA